MYKITINDTPLFLKELPASIPTPKNDRNLIGIYRGKKKSLLNYANLLEKSPHYEQVTLFAEDVEQLKDDFFSHYKIVKAAGGVVYNELGEVLVIFRMQKWDLPKGKIEENESIQVAAIREVEEETGIESVELGDLIEITYHTYFSRKGKRILKPTYWYRMTASKQLLTAQKEEDIEKAEWVDLSSFLSKEPDSYDNILALLHAELEREKA